MRSSACATAEYSAVIVVVALVLLMVLNVGVSTLEALRPEDRPDQTASLPERPDQRDLLKGFG